MTAPSFLKAPGFWDRDSVTARLLQPVGFVYGLISGRRMRQSPAGSVAIPVICVGNLTLGGAGKTPTVTYLARYFASAGHRPFILSRGYKGRLAGPLIVDATKHTAEDVGDEPSLMGRDFSVVIGADRVASAQLALKAGATLLLMDDGLQNPRLKRDIKLAVVDGASGVGNRLVFPAGPLRAGLDAQLGFADAVLVIGNGEKGQIVAARALKLGTPVFTGALVPDEAAKRLAGLKALAFCGLGRPEKFRASLEQVGVDLAGFVAFADHHVPTKDEADSLVRRAQKDGLALVTTPKDQARLLGDAYTRQVLAGLVNVAGIELALDDESAFLSWMREKIKHRAVCLD